MSSPTSKSNINPKEKQVHFDNNGNRTPTRSRPRSPLHGLSHHSPDKTHRQSNQPVTTQPVTTSEPPEQRGPSTSTPFFNSAEDIPTAGQHIFTHHTYPAAQPIFHPGPASATHQGPLPAYLYPSPGFFNPHQQPQRPPAVISTTATYPVYPAPVLHPSFQGFVPSSAMGDYQNSFQPPTGHHFQPPVPDTSFGPFTHIYYPRSDTGIMFAHPATTVSAAYQIRPVIYQGSAQMYFRAPTPPPPVFQYYMTPTHFVFPAVGMGIPVGGVAPATAPFTPIVLQQQMPQPMMVGGGVAPQVVGGQPIMMAHGPPQVVAGNAPPPPAGGPPGIAAMGGGGVAFEPALGVGATASEIAAAQAHFAYQNNMYEAQDFKPADDDPSRYYMVRELDGAWTQRNRFTIDNLGCRWYMTDGGCFYAVRLPS